MRDGGEQERFVDVVNKSYHVHAAGAQDKSCVKVCCDSHCFLNFDVTTQVVGETSFLVGLTQRRGVLSHCTDRYNCKY